MDHHDDAETRSYAPDEVRMFALKGIPLVSPGDDVGATVTRACRAAGEELADDDIVVVAQKIVSKAEGRLVELAQITPGPEAIARGRATGKDPALVQLILDESVAVLRQHHGVIIVEHRLGFVMANAGIDQSNARPGKAILLPKDPDASARAIAGSLRRLCGRRVGVIVSDSIGRAWRNGTVGQALGVAGLRPLLDLRGSKDLFERRMQVTEVAIADEIAAAASLLMGQGNEAKPVVVVRGFPPLRDRAATAQSLIRQKERDLFR